MPWARVSDRLGLPPIILHSTITLSNWRLINTELSLTLDNLTTLYSLDTTRDLQVFFMIPLLVELRAVPAIKALVQILISDNEVESEVSSCLDVVSASLNEMTRELTRMHSQVSPSLFYHKHRVLLSGWRDNPSLPEGLLYQGVADHPLQFSGGSAAQSSVIQMIDVCLGVEHGEREGEFLLRMRQYMPPNQRKMLEQLASYPSLRTVCEGREELEGKYNECLARLAELRTQHLILVSRYIISQVYIAEVRDILIIFLYFQANVNRGQAEHLSRQGTGGTQLATFLKKIRKDIKDKLF